MQNNITKPYCCSVIISLANAGYACRNSSYRRNILESVVQLLPEAKSKLSPELQIYKYLLHQHFLYFFLDRKYLWWKTGRLLHNLFSQSDILPVRIFAFQLLLIFCCSTFCLVTFCQSNSRQITSVRAWSCPLCTQTPMNLQNTPNILSGWLIIYTQRIMDTDSGIHYSFIQRERVIK